MSTYVPDAVQAGKGTKAERIDHPLLSSPFSQGKRRCPGSRVARNETNVFVAQLLLDWKLTAPDVSHWKDIPVQLETLFAPEIPRLVVEPARKQ